MNRDLSLDVLRGIMLIIMAADHFGEPLFQHLYEFAGYVSAAEGFVFLSGMLVALVYSRYHSAGGYVLEQRVASCRGDLLVSLNGAVGGVCVHGSDGFVGGVLEKFCHGNAG